MTSRSAEASHSRPNPVRPNQPPDLGTHVTDRYKQQSIQRDADLRSSTPRVFPSSGWDNIDPSCLIEEENIPTYKPERFYPAHIGEILNRRYQIVGKLGYGSSATVWLCRDIWGDCFITLKIYAALTSPTREIEVYKHLSTIQSDHAGQSCLRPLTDIFHTRNPDGHKMHTCLVHPPLGISLDQCHDLQPNNMLLGTKDNSILSNFEQAEFDAPIPRKTLEDRTIYITRPLPISLGTPVLCDLGEARVGIDQQRGDIMPDVYRAPEVILDMTWDYKVDIWNVGMVIWDLMERHHLFKARNPDRRLDDGVHLAEMHALLGCPPREFLSRSEKSLQFWDANGQWKGAAPFPDYNLETREEKLHGDEKSDFLRFLRRALCWLPEKRATAKELLFDPWMMHGLRLKKPAEGNR
ncbi:kinase-like protein [Aspergillus campestris IBT 28561]|uniref:Kinase-like protein n=1 Tax=Aspergillus campestris (strain IBT 28561) TaxID=1392248 RepID=A0A2I1D953_ASPC2|nr:kinase-like protein [Aspergillus campestris IBT 28561]PKY06388.1 kinase-like protein [Aspergillus campestris IBT 28561]